MNIWVLKAHHEKAQIIKCDVTVPNYDRLKFKDYDWFQQYPDAKEDISPDAPELLQTKYPASITCYCDVDQTHTSWRQGEASLEQYSL